MLVKFIGTLLRFITSTCIILFLLLIVLAWAPNYFDTTAEVNQAGLQRARVERLAGYSLRLQADPEDSVQTVAVLQTTLPAFELEEKTLSQSNDPQVLFSEQTAQSAYIHIDQAAHNVLTMYLKTKRVDTTQTAIILQYERPYFLTANELVYYLQYQAQDRDTEVAILQTTLLVVLIGIGIGIHIMLRKKLCPTNIMEEK